VIALLSLLSTGESGEWFTIDELSRRLRCPRRAVENAIENLRLSGEPIIAGAEGVRLTDNPRELGEYVEARRRRAAEIHRGTMRLRSTLRRMEQGDLTLWGAA
jgi:biotin operon repressor